jgi:hypothetical protein
MIFCLLLCVRQPEIMQTKGPLGISWLSSVELHAKSCDTILRFFAQKRKKDLCNLRLRYSAFRIFSIDLYHLLLLKPNDWKQFTQDNKRLLCIYLSYAQASNFMFNPQFIFTDFFVLSLSF